MKKNVRDVLYVFTIIFFFFFSVAKVSANSIRKIEMDVYLDSNGNATITEVWNAYLNEGSEGYRSYSKLGNSTISNFIVSDDSGITYEFVSDWNEFSTFQYKSYKNGIKYTSNGVELCWGISKYGDRTYILKYTINNFVTQYTDTQGIYFNFLNFKQHIQNAKIRIYSEIPFSLDNSRIWSFGYNGVINFENGNIILDSKGDISSTQYMVALVRFNSNLFNTSNISDSSFDDIYDSALEDVKDTQSSKPLIIRIITVPFYVLSVLLMFFVPVLPFAIIAALLATKKNERDKIKGLSNQLYFGSEGNVLPTSSKIDYYRDIPCNKDLERAYWICYQYNIVPKDTLKQGVIGALLLKWIKNGWITVSKTKEGLFSIKDNNYAIDLGNTSNMDNEIEKKLYNILVSAAGFNKVLEAKEFSKWCKKNYNKINSWFSSIIDKEQAILERQGLITNGTSETPGTFNTTQKFKIKIVDKKLKEEAIQIVGLKKYLLEFSMISDRDYFEVHIWEEYLIFAELLGIADKVEEQFSKLNPKFKEKIFNNTYMSTDVVKSISEMCYDEVRYGLEQERIVRKQRLERQRDYSGTSRDSGGGGSSYSSGGSSSGGSSGGGFR